MRTLVYFASGSIRDEYQDLDFDRIFLVDKCFRNNRISNKRIFTVGKITCIGMDCLESIEYLKKKEVSLDYFVSLSEGIYEGSGSYAINSDMFLGYAMPLFKDHYIHIMNKNYYNNDYHVTMDLPFIKNEIHSDDPDYLDPFIFSKEKYHIGHAKVFRMTRVEDKKEIRINPKIRISIIHDSIWGHSDELDALVISFANQGQAGFFDRVHKTLNIKETSLDEILDSCESNKVHRIGFTPWGNGCYRYFIKKMEERKSDYPGEILLFHLNENDYREIKDYALKNV